MHLLIARKRIALFPLPKIRIFKCGDDEGTRATSERRERGRALSHCCTHVRAEREVNVQREHVCRPREQACGVAPRVELPAMRGAGEVDVDAQGKRGRRGVERMKGVEECRCSATVRARNVDGDGDRTCAVNLSEKFGRWWEVAKHRGRSRQVARRRRTGRS